jgi:hypothetical protein
MRIGKGCSVSTTRYAMSNGSSHGIFFSIRKTAINLCPIVRRKFDIGPGRFVKTKATCNHNTFRRRPNATAHFASIRKRRIPLLEIEDTVCGQPPVPSPSWQTRLSLRLGPFKHTCLEYTD